MSGVAAALPAGPVTDTARRERLDRVLVRPLLWLTIFASCIVTFEPSPYEFCFLVLCWAVLVRGLTIPAFLAPVVLLLPVAFSLGGLTAVMQIINESDAVRFVAISAYLGFTTVIFAALVAENPMDRLRVIRAAYIPAAVVAASAGIVGYFDLVPGASDVFTLYGRARGTFKDPNVYGPFLIFPALLLMQDLLTRTGRRVLPSALWLSVIVAGLLLSFSRAAWGHLIVSMLLMALLMLALSPDPRLRLRIGIGAALGGLALAGLVMGILAVPEVSEAFRQRADLGQSYDVGETGRFATQQRAFWEIIDRPFGLGPLRYGKHYGLDPHNVYLNAFSAYGWLGGLSYITFVVLTWIVAIRFAFVRTPWQAFHIAALATFLPLSLEGFIIDTDHWRHFFLIAGLLWGMSAAAASLRGRLPAARQRGVGTNTDPIRT